MSVEITHAAPLLALAPRTSDRWTLMEARLVAAQVQDHLDRAIGRLVGLDGGAQLPPEVEDLLRAAQRSVATGREQVAAARRLLTLP